jgi:hypothetical protein
MPAEKKVCLVFDQAGALSGNWVIDFRLPFAATLIEASFGGSNSNNATLSIGNGSSATAYLTATDFGDSSVPVVKTVSDFTSEFIADDTVMKLTIDYDGAQGTAIADPVILLTFLVGA